MKTPLGLILVILPLTLLLNSCSDESTPKTKADRLIDVCFNTLEAHSYYSLYLNEEASSYYTPNSIFFSLPDTLKGNYYSYYTEKGGIDGYPWPLFAPQSTEGSFGIILSSINDTIVVQKSFNDGSAY